MNIKTKFNVNDEVWFINPRNVMPIKGVIYEIKIHVKSAPVYKRQQVGPMQQNGIRPTEPKIIYVFKLYGPELERDEGYLFKTKEALLKSLK